MTSSNPLGDHTAGKIARPALNLSGLNAGLLMTAVISLAAGITLAAPGFHPNPLFRLLPILPALALLFTSGHGSGLRALLLTATFFFLIGIFYPGQEEPLRNPHHIYHQLSSPQEISLTGILSASPTWSGDKYRLLMEVTSFRQPGRTGSACGLVRLSAPAPLPADLLPGDSFMVRTSLSPAHNYGNPGVFDYRHFLATQDIYLTGRIRSHAEIIKINEPSQNGFARRLRYFPERCRYHISRFLDATLESRNAGFYKAILIGDSGSLAPDLEEHFKAAGCYHLLAISGTHLALLALLTTATSLWLLKRSNWILLHLPARKIAIFLAIIPLIAYSLIAGFNTPVIRSLLMTLAVFLALILDRQQSVPAAISLAVLIILFVQPMSLFTASFQLSFAAVIGIALFLPLISDRLPMKFTEETETSPSMKIKKYLLAGLAISLAATAATLPLSFFYFNRFSPLSPLSTLLIEPLLCIWSLSLGLIGSLFIPLAPGLASLLFHLGSYGLTLADRLISLLAALPLSSIYFSTPSLAEICSYYLLLLSLAGWTRFRPARFLAVTALFCLIAIPLSEKIGTMLSHRTTVTFLDMGQGSSTLLQLPHGRTILLDGGGSNSNDFNPGERLIAPFLWRQKILRLDGLVISHAHADHYNGLEFILKTFRPSVLWVGDRKVAEPDYNRLLRRAEELGIETRKLQGEEPLLKDKGYALVSLGGPHHGDTEDADSNKQLPGSETNNSSLVLRLDSAGFSFLFPGDIEKAVEEKLLAAGHNLNVDILLAPHHGSRTSSTDPFIAATSPQYLVISAGPYLPKVFPSPEVVARYRQAQAQILSTAVCGAVTFSVEEETLAIQTFYPACPL